MHLVYHPAVQINISLPGRDDTKTELVPTTKASRYWFSHDILMSIRQEARVQYGTKVRLVIGFSRLASGLAH